MLTFQYTGNKFRAPECFLGRVIRHWAKMKHHKFPSHYYLALAKSLSSETFMAYKFTLHHCRYINYCIAKKNPFTTLFAS